MLGRLSADMLKVSILLIFVRFVGITKEIILAYKFGASPILDGYLFVFNIIGWLSSNLESVAVFTLVPLFTQMRMSGRVAESAEFRNELLGATILMALVVGFVLLTGLSCAIQWNILRLPAEVKSAALPASICLPLGLLFVFSGSILYVFSISNSQYKVNLVDGSLAICIGATVWLNPKPNIWALIVGTLLGLFVKWLFLCWMNRYYPPLKIRWGFSSAAWSGFYRSIGTMTIAHTILSTTTLIDLFLASRQGEGALTTYNYASLVVNGILSLLTLPISRTALPIFCQADGKSNSEQSALLFNRFLAGMFLFCIFISGLIWYFAEIVTRLLFERGAFTAQDTEAVSNILKTLILLMPFYVGWIIVFYKLTSRQIYKTLLKINITVFMVKLISGLILTSLYGLKGLAVSTIIMYLAGLGYTLIVEFRIRRLEG